MENKIVYGSIGILSLIVAALGGTIFLTEDQLDNAYICSVNQNIVIADHLSSTSKTAYWVDDEGLDRSQVCRLGYWLDLKQYASDNQLDLNILLQEGLDPVIIPINGTDGEDGEDGSDGDDGADGSIVYVEVPAGISGGTEYGCNSQKCWIKSQ